MPLIVAYVKKLEFVLLKVPHTAFFWIWESASSKNPLYTVMNMFPIDAY